MANVAHATSITCTRTLSPANSKEKDLIRNPLREVSGLSRSRLAARFAGKANLVVPLLAGVGLWLAMPDQVVTVNKSSNERTSKCPTLIGVAPQRGVQFDALIALVRASRPQSIWHLDKARSRVPTHIRVKQIPGLMQSACHEALALATARKAKAAPLTRTSANLYTEQLPFVFLSRRHWHSNFIYRSFPRFWRDFRPNLSAKKRLANSIPRTAKVTINATATTSFFTVNESQFISILNFHSI
jgi:hypothetical protein